MDRQNNQFKFYYINAPQDLRIDPTFCPVQRRRNWDLFRRLTATDRQNWINYLVLPPPQEGRAPTETYLLDTFSRVIRQF
ncbi:hypothetical protein, partial [Escherichia coli]|uniref:hypothetical protein n=1 Tax=Escherichia coli TaxID=562 RepID=UPI001AD93A18